MTTDRYRAWLADVIRWARTVEHDAEAVADFILEALLRGGVATTPPDTGGT